MPNYHAKIEPVSAVLRIYTEKRDDSVHNTGIPFLFSIMVRWIDDVSVEIMGLSNKITLDMWKAIRDELIAYQVKRVMYTRYKDGEKIEKWISLEKSLDN